MRRRGKTYTASVMAEEFVAASLPFVALDPTGAWWGLRSSADGKKEGLPVVIIGGEHGDVPLESTAGTVIADLVVDHPGYYVVDLSSTESNAAQDRFATDFAERLYRRKNKNRSPLHLFVDEADAFIPQQPLDGQRRMLGAFEAIVRRGGIRGLGTTLITQRAAVLNKNVLTQVDTLIALQMSGTQDQDAIDDWVKRNGTKEQRNEMMSSLASLPIGVSWIWSPGWLGVFQKVHIRQRRTFNSSKTPEPGETVVVPQKLARVDLDKLGKQIAETVERVKENDPAQLKRTIGELRQKLEKAEREKSIPAKQAEPVPYLTPTQEGILTKISTLCSEVFQGFGDIEDKLNKTVALKAEVLSKLSAVTKPTPKPSPYSITATVTGRSPANAGPNLSSLPTSELPLAAHNDFSAGTETEKPNKKCDQAVLTALAQYPNGRTIKQIAILSGYSITSGGFKKSLADLRKAGFITRGHPVQITQEGLKFLGNWEALPTGSDLIQHWLRKLPKCEHNILDILVKKYPEGLHVRELGEASGYAASSGGFKGALSTLRTLELITRTHPITASPDLFQ